MSVKNNIFLLPSNHFLRQNGEAIDLFTTVDNQPDNPRDATCISMTIQQFKDAAVFSVERAYQDGRISTGDIDKLIARLQDIKDVTNTPPAKRTKATEARAAGSAREAQASAKAERDAAKAERKAKKEARKGGTVYLKGFDGKAVSKEVSEAHAKELGAVTKKSKKKAVAAISRSQTAKEVKDKPSKPKGGKGK